jgi:hypothetical protein
VRRSGILVLDNNCYGRLVSDQARERFCANLRVADLVAAPSEVNLLEAAAAPPAVRAQLLATIKDILDDRPLLPWPFWLLRRIGEASLAGDPIVELDYSGTEWYFDDPKAVDDLRAKVEAFTRELEGPYSTMHANARKTLRRMMKQRGWGDAWGNTRAFLEQQWRPGDVRESFAAQLWRALGLPADAPVKELVANPAWSLMLDGEGVAVYARALAHTQPKKVQRADLIQLVYLGGADRRVIATADAAFLEAASAVLAAYPNARAIHIDRLLE